MYDAILIPTDGSPGAENAVEHAVAIAERFGAELHALYVADVRGVADVGAGSMPADAEEAARRATNSVEQAAAACDVPVVTSVAGGTPEETIVEYGADNDVDLIVLGSHGKTGLSRVLLGNTAEGVVRNAGRPVVTVPPKDDDQSDDELSTDESAR